MATINALTGRAINDAQSAGISKSITMGANRFYEIVNALRDGCCCNRCQENANFLLLNATTSTR